jgi:hypothetical protein
LGLLFDGGWGVFFVFGSSGGLWWVSFWLVFVLAVLSASLGMLFVIILLLLVITLLFLFFSV